MHLKFTGAELLATQGIVSLGIAVIPFKTHRLTLPNRVLRSSSREIHTSPYVHHNVDDKTFPSFYLMSDFFKTKGSPNPDPQNLEKEKFIGYVESFIN